jgi:hypothetical protein
VSNGSIKSSLTRSEDKGREERGCILGGEELGGALHRSSGPPSLIFV